MTDVDSTSTQSMRRGGVGVIGMEERARAIGGTLYIVSVAERGTTIRIKAPLKQRPTTSIPDVSTPSVAARADQSMLVG
jgi:signal transduction histidine kinase